MAHRYARLSAIRKLAGGRSGPQAGAAGPDDHCNRKERAYTAPNPWNIPADGTPLSEDV
jgi:hypothetical protein